MEPFSKHTIESITDLYGRDELISSLKAYARRRENVALIGTRRFGKTCLFKSLCNLFLTSEDSPVFPVFLDFKEVSYAIKGTAEVYRFILARLIEELFRGGFYTKKEDYQGLDIVPTNNWEDNYENLQSIKIVQLNATISKMIKCFSDIMEKTILFMIDEYEHLFRESFTSPEGFMPLRTLSSDNENGQIKPFAFWIAGAVGWKELCSQIGSGELNVINTSLIVLPLAQEDFNNMWMYEVSLCDDKDKRDYLISKKEFAYQKTGGIPYYAKVLGSRLIVDGVEPDYTVLSDYFDQIYNTLNQAERKLIKEIAVLPKNYKESRELRSLMDKGLIHKVGNKYEVRIGYLTDYLKTIVDDSSVFRTTKTEELTEQIFNLFSAINDHRIRKGKERIFDGTNVDFSLMKGMKKLCQSEDDFKLFIGNIYLSFFEKTKTDGKNGNKLPDAVHFSSFGNAVGVLRHVCGGHIEEKMEFNTGQMTKTDALIYFKGNDVVPYHPDEFADLQIAVLTKYKDELVRLLALVRKE